MRQSLSLADVAQIVMGQSPPGETYNSEGLGLPFFQGKAEFGQHHPTPVKWCSEPVRIAEPGDILLSVRAPVGPTNVAAERCCIGRGLAAIRVRADIAEPRFIGYFLRRFQSDIAAQGVGSTFAAIGRADIVRLRIPLCSLPEQQRIVRILDEADVLRKLRTKADERTRELIPAIFHEVFGDPLTNPKRWPLADLGSLCTIRRGASPRPIDRFLGGTVPWIKIGDATSRGDDLYIHRTAEKVTEEGAARSVYLKPGSLVFANCGVSLGFARILRTGGCIHDGWLSFADLSPTVSDVYLLKLLNTVTKYFRRIAPDGTQPNLNTAIMKRFRVPLPPIELQQSFAARVEEVRAMQEKQAESRRKLDELFESLLHRAFAGEL